MDSFCRCVGVSSVHLREIRVKNTVAHVPLRLKYEYIYINTYYSDLYWKLKRLSNCVFLPGTISYFAYLYIFCCIFLSSRLARCATFQVGVHDTQRVPAEVFCALSLFILFPLQLNLYKNIYIVFVEHSTFYRARCSSSVEKCRFFFLVFDTTSKWFLIGVLFFCVLSS